MKERTPEQLKGQIRKKLWNNYCENNAYASEVSFEDAMETTLQIAEIIRF